MGGWVGVWVCGHTRVGSLIVLFNIGRKHVPSVPTDFGSNFFHCQSEFGEKLFI